MTFATVKHRTKVTKEPDSKAAGIAMAFKHKRRPCKGPVAIGCDQLCDSKPVGRGSLLGHEIASGQSKAFRSPDGLV